LLVVGGGNQRRSPLWCSPRTSWFEVGQCSERTFRAPPCVRVDVRVDTRRGACSTSLQRPVVLQSESSGDW
jgi:hypothetical protein